MSDPVPKRRRWNQFRLSSLLWLTLFAPVAFFAFSEHRLRRQVEAEYESQRTELLKYIDLKQRLDNGFLLQAEAIKQKQRAFDESQRFLVCEGCGEVTVKNTGIELPLGWSNSTKATCWTKSDKWLKALILCPACAAEPEVAVKRFKALHRMYD